VILNGFQITLMIVAVDQQKLAWLLKENCSASIASSTTQDSFIWKHFNVMSRDNSRKRRIMKKSG